MPAVLALLILLGALGFAGEPSGPRRVPLAAGVLLIADPALPDPNFARTVVLVIRHGKDGSLGLVLNRPAELDFRGVFPELSAPEGRGSVHLGGPVATNRIQLLSGGGPAEARIVDGVYLVRSEQELKQAVADPSAPTLRAYAGHAGWAPGQLDAEIARGDWHLLPARAADVFASGPDTAELWRRLIDRSTLPWV